MRHEREAPFQGIDNGGDMLSTYLDTGDKD